MSDEPTMGEVLRRLDEVSRQMTEVAREMKEDRVSNAATFVRQDVYVAQRLADQTVVADVAGDVRSVREELRRHVTSQDEQRRTDTNFRRQVLLGFAVAGVGWLLTIALFVVTFVTRS